MDNKTLAQEIGARIRKFRMLKGWSQKDLGDKIGTTSAAISKYEKEVHDIDVIKSLSNALDFDLLNDEMDQEGEIGEIGLEILSHIIKDSYDCNETTSNGFIDAEALLDKDNLFGLSKEKRLHELTKLEKIGLCVREQFTDFHDGDWDIVFITAKGLIAFKRRLPEAYDFEKIKTYEEYCHGNDSIQDYIDSVPLEKDLEQMDFSSAFRYNYYAFLADKLKKFDFMDRPSLTDSFFNGISCYENIMFSMMVGFTREEADTWVKMKKCFVSFDGNERLNIDSTDLFLTDEEKSLSEKIKDTGEYQEYEDYCNYQGKFSEDVEYDFVDFLVNNINENFKIDDYKELDNYWENEASGEFKRFLDLQEERHEKIQNLRDDYVSRLNKLKSISTETDVRKMFSENQIKKWVKKNIRKPENEQEEKLQLVMREALEKYASARNYFVLPQEWVSNGLADIVWEAYGILDIMKKYPNEISGISIHEPIMVLQGL